MSAARAVDLHIHSDFSDGRPGYREIVDRVVELGLEAAAITDHFDPYDAEHPCPSEDALLDFFARIRDYAGAVGANVLCGIETCAGPEGELRLGDRALEACDILIASPHYVEHPGIAIAGEYLDEGYWSSYRRKVLRMAAGGADVLGHCEGYLPLGPLLAPGTTDYEGRKRICAEIVERCFDDEYVEALAEAASASGVAVELHCATRTPRPLVIDRLVARGVKLSLGSDAHELAMVGAVEWGMGMIRERGGGDLQYLPRRAFPAKG